MQFGVVPHAVAVPTNVDDVAVVDEPVDQHRRHDLVTENVAPLRKALVGGEDRGELRQSAHRTYPAGTSTISGPGPWWARRAQNGSVPIWGGDTLSPDGVTMPVLAD